MRDLLTTEQRSALMRHVAAERPRGDRLCEACGTLMPQKTSRARFCSSRCRMRVYRASAAKVRERQKPQPKR